MYPCKFKRCGDLRRRARTRGRLEAADPLKLLSGCAGNHLNGLSLGGRGTGLHAGSSSRGSIVLDAAPTPVSHRVLLSSGAARDTSRVSNRCRLLCGRLACEISHLCSHRRLLPGENPSNPKPGSSARGSTIGRMRTHPRGVAPRTSSTKPRIDPHVQTAMWVAKHRRTVSAPPPDARTRTSQRPQDAARSWRALIRSSILGTHAEFPYFSFSFAHAECSRSWSLSHSYSSFALQDRVSRKVTRPK